jgi:thiol-disulfide isomerase/thioredoxin
MDSSTYHFKYQLTKQTNTVVIYFNPDCEHCKIEAKNIVDSLAQFKETQFVFASYAPFKEIQQFAADYNLLLHKNIIVGRDEQYFIPRFFKVRFTPFVAVYNKDGVLLKAFEGGASVKKLLDTLE